jgi:methylenetetrahydrofolate dehydrogenase (NADP+)/methenyltetrahydrofolate cyclohydrolase
MLIGDTDGFYPCTPLGIKTLLDRSGIELTGQHALIIGRSNIVGKPMAALLMQASIGGHATVTVANSYTKDLKSLCLTADIVIAAIGKPKFITADMIKEGTVVIDVGINKIDSPTSPKGYQIVGDVDFENVKDKCSYITPVPKGVGPMTIAMLLSNTMLSYERRS